MATSEATLLAPTPGATSPHPVAASAPERVGPHHGLSLRSGVLMPGDHVTLDGVPGVIDEMNARMDVSELDYGTGPIASWPEHRPMLTTGWKVDYKIRLDPGFGVFGDERALPVFPELAQVLAQRREALMMRQVEDMTRPQPGGNMVGMATAITAATYGSGSITGGTTGGGGIYYTPTTATSTTGTGSVRYYNVDSSGGPEIIDLASPGAMRLTPTEWRQAWPETQTCRWGTDTSDATSWSIRWCDAATTNATVRVQYQYYGETLWEPAAPLKSPQDRLRDIITSRQAPLFLRNNPQRNTLRTTDDFRELRARDTLARVVGEDKFRRFVRDGFVTARGRSGRTYQIFPGSGFTRVFHNGQLAERLCVVLNGDFPPTDSLIVRFLMILNDEEGFRKLAIKHGLPATAPVVANENAGRTLPQIYAELKRHDPDRRASDGTKGGNNGSNGNGRVVRPMEGAGAVRVA